MIKSIDCSDPEPYGKSHDEIGKVLLARSHATWQAAGCMIEPPDPRGQSLLMVSNLLKGVFYGIVGLFIAGSLLLGNDGFTTAAAALVPAGVFPESFDVGFLVAFSGVLLAIGAAWASWYLQQKGEQLLRLAPQDKAGRASSSRNIGKRMVLWSIALIMIAGGAIAFAQPFIPLFTETAPSPAMTIREMMLTFVGIAGLGVLVAGCTIAERAWHLGAPSAAELQAKDPRSPVLLLRSFHDDDLTIVRRIKKGKGTETSFVRLEEAVADQFSPYGPLVAIGRPGEPLPATGAARNYYTDAEWQAAIAKWMDEAQVILLVPGMTKGLGWELDAIEKRGHIGKLMIMMPPLVGTWSQLWRTTPVIGHAIGGLATLGLLTDSDATARTNLQQRWDIVRNALSDVHAFAGLPEKVEDGTIILHLDASRNPTIVVGSERASEDEYEAAIRLAVYGMSCAA